MTTVNWMPKYYKSKDRNSNDQIYKYQPNTQT
jgi:hypothetical protein